MRLRLRVNGAVQELETNPNRTVLSLLREDLRLTGTKQGCMVGVCGLCSVLLDGQLTSACLLLAPVAPMPRLRMSSALTVPPKSAAPRTCSRGAVWNERLLVSNGR